LVWGDALLILDLRLDVVDGIRRLNVECNGLTREGLDEYLHGDTYYFADYEKYLHSSKR
jgi:hypothetical protein